MKVSTIARTVLVFCILVSLWFVRVHTRQSVLFFGHHPPFTAFIIEIIIGAIVLLVAFLAIFGFVLALFGAFDEAN